MQNGNPDAAQPLDFGCNNLLGPLPEPRMWYDHATQKCHGMAPTGGTNERLWDACDMHAYAAAAVAAERERWAERVRSMCAADLRAGPGFYGDDAWIEAYKDLASMAGVECGY